MSVKACLRPLAAQLVDMADRRGITPVLTLEPGLSLAPEFFGCLADTLASQVDRQIRFDLVVSAERWIGGPRRWLALREAARLSTVMPASASVSVGATVGRPGGQGRPLVIGIAKDKIELPIWAQRVAVRTRPTDLRDIQLMPVAS